MRKALDGIYGAALVAACTAMVAIAALVFVQVAGRIVDRSMIAAGYAPFGIAIPSLAEIGGFLFVAAAFLALPATLRSAAHVRVTLVAQNAGPKLRRVLTLAVLAMALGLAGFATWHSAAQALDSYSFDTMSYGTIPIPLWIPQAGMTLGLALFALALLDELASALSGRTPAFLAAEAQAERATSGGAGADEPDPEPGAHRRSAGEATGRKTTNETDGPGAGR